MFAEMRLFTKSYHVVSKTTPDIQYTKSQVDGYYFNEYYFEMRYIRIRLTYSYSNVLCGSEARQELRTQIDGMV